MAAELQHTVRENAEELREFLKDLGRWEKDIKRKDEDLKKERIIEKPDIPPIRNKKKSKKTVKKKGEKAKRTNGNKTRISSYDYDAWSKFDVDAACEKVEREDKEDEESYSDEEPDEEELEELERIEQERKLQRANLEKEKGNELFKEGKYEAAINRYTIGIELDPYNAILPANRAMALIKVERYGAAEVDCTASLELDRTYVKALARRATARYKLGKLELAKVDYEEVLIIQPNNKQAITELQKIDKELLSRKPKTSANDPVSSRKRRSNKPLKRITIEEIGSDSDSESEDKSTGQKKDLDANIVKTDACPTYNEPTTTSELSSHKRSIIIDKEEKLEVPVVDIVLQIPKSSVQFETDFRRVKNNPEELYQYIKIIPPISYPKLFSQTIDDVLPKILRCLKDCYARYNISYWEELNSLSKVPRFEMARMFLSGKDKDAVKELFDQLLRENSQDTTNVSKSDIHQLAKKYGIQSS